MYRRLCVPILAALLSLGCGHEEPVAHSITAVTHPARGEKPAPLPSRLTMTVGGVPWHYAVYRPTGTSGALPVVILLHGRGGTGEPFAVGSHLDALAQEKGFLLIAPNSQGDRWRDLDKDPLQKRDLAFFDALLHAVPSMGGDSKRVYVSGFSNGGGMTFFLGAHFSDRIAAIAPGGASVGALDDNLVYHGLPDPKRHIPALIFHGMADEISGYDMRTFSVPLPDAARWWAKRIGAGETPKHEERDNGAILVDTFGGDGSPQTVLMSFRDLGHVWPGDYDATLNENFDEVLWTFLSKYKLD
jgi:polyhydroxybutyrate depolymerase